MLYVISWVVILLVAVIAIPAAAMVEKKKMRSLYPEDVAADDGDDGESADGESADGDPSEPAQEDAEGFPESEEVAVEVEEDSDALGAAAPDDFTAFDEELK
jgi:hypothetical protein